MRSFLLLAALALTGCGGAEEPRLTVYAAASLTDAFEELAPDARFNVAGSDELATQLREGADADVYAAASPRYPDELHVEGIVEAPVVFATNRLVIVVPSGNPGRIFDLAGLTVADVRLVIGAEGVPIGDYTRELFERAGYPEALDRVVSEEEDVKGVLGKVALGEAEAGVVYATDARAAGDDVEAVEIPPSQQGRIEYPVAVVAAARNRGAAREFVSLLLSARGRAVLRRAGFGAP